MSDLMFVESPTKVKSIGKYLHDRNMKIVATRGHIRDLAKGWLDFGPGKLTIKWEDKDSSTIREIKKAADQAQKIYLSTDPDREGEAISWHIFEVIGRENQKKCFRAVFNEISEKAVKWAIENPRNLDQAQVDSYLARRLLDRWIGFKLSQYTGKKMGGESAGRVQSIALKFLADREEEIKAFKREKWFVLEVTLNNDLAISLCHISKDLRDQIKTIESDDKTKVKLASSVDAELLLQKLDSDYRLDEITDPKFFLDNPPKPFKTSTLYERVINTFSMKSDMVREISQKLYEGISLGGEVISLITYPRTDKTDLSMDFEKDLKRYFLFKADEDYWNPDKSSNSSLEKKKEITVQGAHEGIRPVDLSWTPEKVAKFISKSSPEYKVYSLIWANTLAAYSKPTKLQSRKYIFSNQENLFLAIETLEVYDGFKKFFRDYGLMEAAEEPNPVLCELKKGEIYTQKSFSIEERQNNPPGKYNEASLIKALEQKGIGRPSTYPTISKTVLKRNYAIIKNKKFEITELGIRISKDLDKNFSNFISYDYTRNMEEELDNISQSKQDWKKFLENLFIEWVDAFQKAEKIDIIEGRTCPKCGSVLARKFARKRKGFSGNIASHFIGCTNFPKCKYLEKTITSQKESGETLDKNCPDCSASLVRRKNRWNKFFIACSNFPKCTYSEKEAVQLELVENDFCKGCSAQLVYKESPKRPGKKFKACPNFPKCRYRVNFSKNKKS